MKDLPIENILKYGKKQKTLGEGAYGRVDLYSSGNAIKFFLNVDPGNGLPEDSLREIAIMSKICCQCNLTPIIDAGVEIDPKTKNYQPYAVMPLARNGTLDSYITKPLTNNAKLMIAYQFIKGVAELHRANILHRDIKPENALVFGDPTVGGCQITIADFGLAFHGECTSSQEKDHTAYTYPYRPPEVFYEGNYSFPADIWASGLTILEVFTGERFLLDFDGEDKIIHMITKYFGPITEITYPGVVSLPSYKKYSRSTNPEFKIKEYRSKLGDDVFDLIVKMLTVDPSKRLSAQQAMAHPVFDIIRTEVNPTPICDMSRTGELRYPHPPVYDRPNVLNTICNVAAGLGFRRSTIAQAYHLLDRCMQVAPESNPELAACAALTVAAKLRENFYPSLIDIFNEFGYDGDKKNAELIERQFVLTLKFNLYDDTILDILQVYSRFYGEDVANLSRALMMLVYLTYAMIDTKLSDIVVAVLFIACKVRAIEFKHTSYMGDDAKWIVDRLTSPDGDLEKLIPMKTEVERIMVMREKLNIQKLLKIYNTDASLDLPPLRRNRPPRKVGPIMTLL